MFLVKSPTTGDYYILSANKQMLIESIICKKNGTISVDNFIRNRKNFGKSTGGATYKVFSVPRAVSPVKTTFPVIFKFNNIVDFDERIMSEYEHIKSRLVCTIGVVKNKKIGIEIG